MEYRQGVFDGLRHRLHDQLAAMTRSRRRELLRRWAELCPGLGAADLVAPADVVAWVWSLPTTRADQVLRGLVSAAQGGDQAAAMVVVLCLEPGICWLVTRRSRSRQSVDEVVSELAARLYEFPVGRRRAVAAGLLRDVRARLWRDADQARRCIPVGLRPDMLERGRGDEGSPAWLSNGGWSSPADHVVSLVSRAVQDGALRSGEARLLVETRVLGERCSDVARRMGWSPKAGYHRRARAEAELARQYRESIT